MSDKPPETEANVNRHQSRSINSIVGCPIDVNALIGRIESLSKLLATCRDSLKSNDYGEDAPGMTAFENDLVKEIDIVLADDEQGR